MTDLRDRMRIYDQAHAPDYWSEVVARASAVDTSQVRRIPWMLIAATLLLALTLGGAVLVGSGLIKLPALPILPDPPDASAAPNEATPEATSLPSEQGSAVWTATGHMIEARNRHTATLLADGRVLVAGGADDPNIGILFTAELYDPVSGTWSVTGHMIGARGSHTATLLRDGRVLVTGGNGGGPTYEPTAELYDPASGTWTVTGDMINSRSRYHTATLLLDGKVLVAGGPGGPNESPTAELYDPVSGTWSATGNLIANRDDHTATLLRDGRVLVTGGIFGDPTGEITAELYDPANGTWTATGTGNHSENRAFSTATLLPDGKVLVAGGLVLSDGGGGVQVLASAELYDPSLGVWTSAGSMGVAREGHTATLLPDGTVLVAGGAGDFPGLGALSTAELYDPTTGTWTPTANMGDPRSHQTATLMPDGIVLVTGGYVGQAEAATLLASAELYVPGEGN